MKGRYVLVLVLLSGLLGVMVVLQYQRGSKLQAEARAAGAAADSLNTIADSLRKSYTSDTVYLNKWKIKWDTLRLAGKTDTVPKEVIIAIADSTIQACTMALNTCEMRVAVERERADSIESAMDKWKKVTKGPWITPRLEVTVTPQFTPEAALDLSLGRGRLKGLIRAEIGDTATLRAGLSWHP